MTVTVASDGTIWSDESYTLGPGQFHLVLISRSNDGGVTWEWNPINGYGNALDNRIDGNPGVNVIWGYGGNDLLYSGGGDDRVYGGDGDDQIFAGSDANDPVIGGHGPIYDSDYIEGGAGNDQIDGGDGADLMDGGAGDDLFGVEDEGDQVIERADEGWDVVIASIDYALPDHVEELQMVDGAIRGMGNALVNFIVGTDADNILDGDAGADELEGGLGNDRYLVDHVDDLVFEEAASGQDRVEATASHTLGYNVEDLTLLGAEAIDGTGNGLHNAIIGNSGDNVLDGGSGSDTLRGGLGHDTYVVDTILDNVVEESGAGTDLVIASVDWTLDANLEHLQLFGTAIVGVGNASNNELSGNQLDNLLDGGSGADRMSGAGGNDTYVVDDSGDVASELAGAGTDTVRASISFALEANLENLVLIGTGEINGTGNLRANALEGNARNNVLDGKAGADTMMGGDGSDTYVVDDVLDRITEATANLATGGTDLVISSVHYSLDANVEDLTLAGTDSINGTGNGINNLILGNSGANLLDGGGGSDTLMGGLGHDIYAVDTTLDEIFEYSGGGTDLVIAFVDWTLAPNFEHLRLLGNATVGVGNAGNNDLFGNEWGNRLDGRGGTDRMFGGEGDDSYSINDTVDSATELLDQGTDTVRASISFTLGANIENLLLTGAGAINGTGNAAANALQGNARNNVLDGKSGADTMVGAGGDDTYIVDNALDRVTETSANPATGGTDLVISSVTHLLSANVEDLRLGAGVIDGTGNGSNNVIYAGAGNNVLNGGAGVDTASYAYAAAGVTVSLISTSGQATGGSGTDRLSAFENLQGSNHADRLTGNAGANALDGGLGNDTLAGGAGNDQLTGGAGLDVFRFDTRLNATGNVDTLTFVARDDTIHLENAIFAKLQAQGVALSAVNFRASAAGVAKDSNDYIVYDNDSGKLFYDADGSGAGAAVHFATLVGAPAITAADFFIV